MWSASSLDYMTWGMLVQGNGVIMMHDTIACEGVAQLFDEIKMPKVNYDVENGLGFVSRSQERIDAIREML